MIVCKNYPPMIFITMLCFGIWYLNWVFSQILNCISESNAQTLSQSHGQARALERWVRTICVYSEHSKSVLCSCTMQGTRRWPIGWYYLHQQDCLYNWTLIISFKSRKRNVYFLKLKEILRCRQWRESYPCNTPWKNCSIIDLRIPGHEVHAGM